MHKTLEQSTDWFSIVGDGYVALLQMIVMPLIFISIVAAFSKIQIGENIMHDIRKEWFIGSISEKEWRRGDRLVYKDYFLFIFKI